MEKRTRKLGLQVQPAFLLYLSCAVSLGTLVYLLRHEDVQIRDFRRPIARRNDSQFAGSPFRSILRAVKSAVGWFVRRKTIDVGWIERVPGSHCGSKGVFMGEWPRRGTKPCGYSLSHEIQSAWTLCSRPNISKPESLFIRQPQPHLSLCRQQLIRQTLNCEP